MWITSHVGMGGCFILDEAETSINNIVERHNYHLRPVHGVENDILTPVEN